MWCPQAPGLLVWCGMRERERKFIGNNSIYELEKKCKQLNSECWKAPPLLDGSYAPRV
jgi:hypothetical protein